MPGIIADTCIWVQSLRDANSAEARELSTLIDLEHIVVPGIIISEILCGARDRGTFNLLLERFRPFSYLEPTMATWTEAGKIGFELRKKGEGVTYERHSDSVALFGAWPVPVYY